MDHDTNVIGALVVALGDRIRDATEEAAGMGGALPGGARLAARVGGRADDRHARRAGCG